MAGFVPSFAALGEAEREEAVVALLDEALCAKLVAQASCVDAPPQPPSAPAPRATPTSALRAAGVRALAGVVAVLRTLTSRRKNPVAQPRRSTDDTSDPAVAALAALRPSLPPAFLAHALRSRFRGDAQAVAAWLLDGGAEADAAHRAWADEREQQLREEEEAAAAREALRSGILDRCACKWLPLLRVLIIALYLQV